MSNIYTVYRNAARELADAGCESPDFDARLLVEHCFGLNKTQLLMNNKQSVDESKLESFNECIKRRTAREPLQYILGKWEFYGLDFTVGEGVLIPRPETELLPEFAIDSLRKTPGSVVYDLCCGSGCIGISVAHYFPTVRVYCIDISDEALKYAELNKKNIGADNVTVIKADIFDGCSPLGLPRPDIILSNPPYIKSAEIKTLQPEISFEPKIALDGGADGLEFYRKTAENWFPFLNKGGSLALECGENQATDILELFLKTASGARIIKDAAESERVVVVKR